MEQLHFEKVVFTTKEACVYLQTNRAWLDSQRKKGNIKSIKMGRNYNYLKTELDSFLSRNNGKEITKDGLIIGEW